MSRIDMALDDIIKEDDRGGISGDGPASTTRRAPRQRSSPYPLRGRGRGGPSRGGRDGRDGRDGRGGRGGGGGRGGMDGAGRYSTPWNAMPHPHLSHYEDPIVPPTGPIPLSSDDYKVSAQSNPKSVAGMIAHTCRNGEAPRLLAKGAAASNQAVKAIAIARNYLAENDIDLSCFIEQKADPDPERGRAMIFVLQKSQNRSRKFAGTCELKVAESSKVSTVAGSIAAKVRDGERVGIVAIGPGSVFQTVCALSLARVYLTEDGLEVMMKPEFVHLDVEGGQRSAIKFNLHIIQL